MKPWLPFQRRRHVGPNSLIVAGRRIPYLQTLTTSERRRLIELSTWFVRDKSFEGARGFRVTDSIRADIAIQACLPILHLDRQYYNGWRAVIIYPGDFVVDREFVDEAGVVHTWRESVAGEAWEQGPVILSWDANIAPDPAMNIVIHEFAHKLDMLNGAPNGLPPLHPDMSLRAWSSAFITAFDKLQVALDRGQSPLIDDYAAASPAEFFAVGSEQFFTAPLRLRSAFPDVYRQLVLFYRQDPAQSVDAS